MFLAWDPHPMNMRFDMRYLTGGDAMFGPNFGGATIYTNDPRGLLRECPNLGAPAEEPASSRCAAKAK